MTKIERFIEDNNIDFSGTGSDFNSSCCIVCGYGCYLGLTFEDFKDQIENLVDNLSTDNILELERVWDYAEYHDYAHYWNTKEAKNTYSF